MIKISGRIWRCLPLFLLGCALQRDFASEGQRPESAPSGSDAGSAGEDVPPADVTDAGGSPSSGENQPLPRGTGAAPCTGCAIDGRCFSFRSLHPTSPCLICEPSRSTTGWSTLDGEPCNDGRWCTDGDSCRAGVCLGDAVVCGDDGVACNGQSVCEESTNGCALPPVRDLCGEGARCDTASGACVTIE